MVMPFISTVTSNAAVTNSVATSQTPGGAGSLTLVSSSVTFGSSAAQKITITSAGNVSNRTFTITGTDVYDNALVESSLTGPNANTVTSSYCFKSVTQIDISGAAAAAITVGNSADAEGMMYVPDTYSNPFSIGMGCAVVSGSPTYSIQHTFYNPIEESFVYKDAVWFTHSVISAKTANQDGNYDFPVYGIKLILTAAGVVRVRLLQSGMGSR